MEACYAEIRRLGGEVLAVSFSPPERVATFLKMQPLPFPALADPTLTAYHDFELGRTSWSGLLGPRIVGRFATMMLRGWLPRKPAAEDDIYQLGGDFVLDRNRRLTFAHRSADPTDRPALADLLRAVRAAVGPVPSTVA